MSTSSVDPHRGILEDATILVIVVDAGGQIVDALGDLTELLGAREDLAGRRPSEVLERAGLRAPEDGAVAVSSFDGHTVESRRVSSGDAGPAALVAIDVTAHLRHDTSIANDVRQIELMFQQIPGATWTTDRDLRVTRFVGRVQQNLGVPHDQIVGMAVQELASTPEPTDPVTVAHLAALHGTCSSFRYLLRERWYEVHVEPLRDEGERITGCIGAAVDVTQRKLDEDRATRKEAELVLAQQRTISLLEATIESTADGILVVGPEGRVVAYNRRFAALWRIPTAIVDRRDDDELLAFVLDQLVDPDAFVRGVRALYDREDDESLDVLRFKDGRVFERYSRPQRVNDETVGRVWSFRDVTDRERQLRRTLVLSDASRLLSTLDAETALDGVARLLVPTFGDACVIDLVAHGSTHRLLAVSLDPASALSPEIPAPVLAGHTSLHDEGERARVAVPLTAAGRVLGAMTMIAAPGRPYSQPEIELFEELARRAGVALENSRSYRTAHDEIRAREEFLAVASHEIRGPIASLRLAVHALQEGLGSTAELVEVIARNEQRLTQFVDDLLDVGRVQAGQLKFVIEPVDLSEAVRDVATRFATELARSGSQLTIEDPGGISGAWDRLRIDQILTNLLSNAIKFGLGKPIEIELAERRGRAIVTVRDHGIGIPADMQPTIFDPFARAVPARRYGGLGLGLYIVRAIVVGLGGTVGVASTPGEGSTFTVELPLERAP